MENSNTIIIDLSSSMNSRPFEKEEIIHNAEFERITLLIDSKINNIKKDCSKSSIRNRNNDTITILGPRGSGKTSFVMSVLKKYETSDDVEILELIDPTLIEEKGHIFLTIISLIKDKVENKFHNNECDPLCTEYQQRKCWDNKLKKLAAGLPSIDIDGESLYANWQDPEHVMKKGLDAVKSAKELEHNFNEIVYKALDILNKKAFLIAFDDIDVNFNNGWKVLETIRKYLTSPQIITLLSGDIKLFSKAIRKQQWENFGTKLLTWEGEKLNRLEEFDEMVTEIESQYMQKIMKSPNRINLSTIGELLNNREINLRINNNENIDRRYANLLKDLGVQNENEAYSIISFLLNLPLRTQIQILKIYEDYNCEQNKNIVNLIDITDNFISDMYELGIDVEHAKSQPKNFCYIAHKFLLKNEILNETYQLLPTTGHINYNSALFSLFTMFSVHSRNNPSMIFEYWIAIATIKNLLTIIPYKSEIKKDEALVPTIEGLSDYSFIGQNKVYRDICSYLSTYIRASLNNKRPGNISPWGGTLILKGLAENAKKGKEIIEDRIDFVFKNATLMERQLAFLPMSIAPFSDKQKSLVVYSFYSLLGAIVELLNRYNNIVKNYDSEDRKILAINSLLNELSQVKDYVMPSFEKVVDSLSQDSINNIEEDEDIQDDEQQTDDENKILAKELYKWMEKYTGCFSIPCHLIGKIATRSFYAMRRLDDRTNCNLGDAMHRRIVIVMNSAIVEDAKENLKYFNLNKDNPIESDKNFIDNLKKLNLQDCDTKNLNFSRWLLSCPLFLLYLNHDKTEDLLNQLCNFITKEYREFDMGIIRFSIYENLQKVTIYSNNKIESAKKGPSENMPVDESKPNFSLEKSRGIKKTIEILKTKYETPRIFLDKDTEEIIKEIEELFRITNSTNRQIDKLKKKCINKDSWDSVILEYK